MSITPTVANDEVFSLGEGPLWDAPRRRILWVDILAKTVMIGTLDGLAIRVIERHAFDGLVGAVTIADDGSLLVAVQEQLVVVHPGGRHETGPRIIPTGDERRLNDGCTDPAGRFIIGTLSLGAPSERETLVQVHHDASVVELDNDLTLSNGLAWSADGTLLYSVDTLRSTIFVRPYDVATGRIGERRVHLVLDDGYPDGIALDTDHHLWVAVWGAGEVRRFNPEGVQVDSIAVPAPHTSSVAFAGDDLRTLVITTAATQLDAQQLAAHPDSGRLFTARVTTPGLPVAPWAGFGHPSPH